MRRRAVVKRETRKINRNIWDYSVSNIEDAVHGRQERAYKILKELQKTEKDKIQLNPIREKQWIRYYKELWATEENNEYNVNCMTDENIDSITIEELNEALKTSKIRKSPGYDGINIELVKYTSL
jgi:hypothetical protein